MGKTKSITPTELEEAERPQLYGSLTVTENEFGQSVWEDYEKIKLLQEGGTGEIYLARRKKQKTSDASSYYAIKMIDKNFIFGIYHKELRNEIQVLTEIDHPNVVRIYETYETRNAMFLVMEYCSGGDLTGGRIIKPSLLEPSLSAYQDHSTTFEAQVAFVLKQILSAMAYCHKRKIVHRDLKLENVLWQSHDDFVVKVIDFGTSQRYRRPRADYTMKLDVGTNYAESPQAIKAGEEYTEKTDLWSIGVIAFTLLSGGVHPFDADKEMDIRNKVVQGEYCMEGSEWNGISDEAKSFVASLLEYDEDKRPTAEEALQSTWLQSYLTEQEKQRQEVLTDEVQDALLYATKEPKLKRLSMMIIAHCAPARKLRELRQAFDALDTSNDGTITYQEFQAAMKNCEFTPKQLTQVFHELDQSKTGVIEYTDFLSATLETRGEIDSELLKEAFETLDVENSGAISKEGLGAKLEGATPSTDCDEVVEEIFEEVLEEADVKEEGKWLFIQTSLYLYWYRHSHKRHVTNLYS
jgi:calcium-dependent protein kinase